MNRTYQCRTGFTLIELLIVIAILVALFAILLPAVFAVRKKFDIDAAQIQIERLGAHLEEYALKERGYPTTEQGLYALVYIPENTMTVPGTTQPGVPGQDPLGAMGSGGMGIGPNTLDSGAGAGGISPPVSSPTNMFPTGGPATGGLTSPALGPGTTALETGTTWNQPFHNPQLYTQLLKRAAPYAKDEKQLIDPWRLPYRYDNSRDQYGLNPYTGEDRPAIWSAGPDRRDDSPNIIRNWDPVEAEQKRQERMRQLQMSSGGMAGGGLGVGPENLMSNPGGGFPQQPGGGFPQQPGGGFPQQPGGGFPQQPGGGFPQQPGGGFPQQPGGGFPQQPGGGFPQQPGGGFPTQQPPGF